MAGVFGDLGPGAWALFALLYGAQATAEATRRIEAGVIKNMEDLAQYWASMKTDDRWNETYNPPT